MHIDLPAILRCPFCSNEGLKLDEVRHRETTTGGERIVTGKVKCPRCGAKYGIKDGILNFLPVTTPNIGIGQFTNQNRLTAWGYERFWRKDALTKLSGRPFPPAEELATVTRMLENPEVEKLTLHNNTVFYLDLACSTSFYARAIVRALDENRLNIGGHDGHVVAIDNSWQMLQESRQFISQDGLTGRISLVRCDAEKLPFIRRAFAGIACGGSLNEFQHPEKALEECRRALATHGRLVMMVQMHAKSQPGSAIQDVLHTLSGIHFFETRRLNNHYRDAGFVLNEQQSDGLITISKLTV
jgi:SAM-dependent methyltransferase/uncharacterized protein YbaR (Trm112 family)